MFAFPVLGLTELALHVACLAGGRFGTVTLSRRSTYPVREMIEAYGLLSRCGGMRIATWGGPRRWQSAHAARTLGSSEVLVVDDWAMAPLADTERRDFLEICEDRYQRRSMILTSQLPVAKWHEQIGDPTLADSILDRLVHNAHRIEMRGESMRKKRGGKE